MICSEKMLRKLHPFLVRSVCGSGCPQTCCVPEGGLILLILLRLARRCWDYRCAVTRPILCGLDLKPWSLYTLDKHTYNSLPQSCEILLFTDRISVTASKR